MRLLFCQECDSLWLSTITVCLDHQSIEANNHSASSNTQWVQTRYTHLCECAYLCLSACVCVAERWKAVVCSSVYFGSVLSLLATTQDQEETRKGEVAASTGDTLPRISLFP